MFSVEYSKEARRSLKAMPRNIAGLIVEKIDGVAVNPYLPNNNVRKLSNHPGYRLRVGDWRVIYLIKEDVFVIAVVRVAPGGDAYL